MLSLNANNKSIRAAFAVLFAICLSFVNLFAGAVSAAPSTNPEPPKPKVTYVAVGEGQQETGEARVEGAAVDASGQLQFRYQGLTMGDGDQRVMFWDVRVSDTELLTATVSYKDKVASKAFNIANKEYPGHVLARALAPKGESVHWKFEYAGRVLLEQDLTVTGAPNHLGLNFRDATNCVADGHILVDPGVVAWEVGNPIPFFFAWIAGSDVDFGPLFFATGRHNIVLKSYNNDGGDRNDWTKWSNQRGELHAEFESACGDTPTEKSFVAVPSINCNQDWIVNVTEQLGVESIVWFVNGTQVNEPKGNLGAASSIAIRAHVKFVDGTEQDFDYTINRKTDCPVTEKSFVAVPNIDCNQNWALQVTAQLGVESIVWFVNGTQVNEPKGNLGAASSIAIRAHVKFVDGTEQDFDYTINRKTDCPSTPETKVVVEPYCDVAYVTTYGFPGFDKLLGQVNGMDVTFVNKSSDGDKVVYKAKYASLNMIGKVTARVELQGKFYSGSNSVSCVKPNEPRTEVTADKACLPSGGISRWVEVRMVYWEPEATGMWVRNGSADEVDALPVPEFPGVQVLIERIENVDGGKNRYNVPASVPPTMEVYAVFHGQQESTGKEVWASAKAPALTYGEIIACSNKWIEARTFDCSAPTLRDQIVINAGGVGLPAGTVTRVFFADTNTEVFINPESGEYLINWSLVDPNQYGWAQFRAEFWYADGSHDTIFSNELRRDYNSCGDEPKKPADVPEICVRLANGQQAIVKVDAIPADAELGENACGAAPYELPRTGANDSLNIVWLALVALLMLAVGSWIRRHA